MRVVPPAVTVTAYASRAIDGTSTGSLSQPSGGRHTGSVPHWW